MTPTRRSTRPFAPAALAAGALLLAAFPAAARDARPAAAAPARADTVPAAPAQAPAQPPTPGQTQAGHAGHAEHGDHHAHGAPATPLTPLARLQLDSARRATAALATPEAARAAGYRPMFGHVPLQGEHWVRVDRVLSGGFELERPSVLMFAPVRGTPTLVGVAYAFLRPTDAPLPRGFDGADGVWHAHERLAPTPGQHLVMMHAWFVEAPEGPFARYNPWLPYLAAGLTPPDAAVLAQPAEGERARRLGLALALGETPPLLFEMLERQGGDSLRARTAPARAALRALVPRLAAAERAGDHASRARLADAAVAQADALVALYRDAAPTRPIVRRLVDRTVDEFLGRGHGIEEELGALFGARGARPAETRPADARP